MKSLALLLIDQGLMSAGFIPIQMRDFTGRANARFLGITPVVDGQVFADVMPISSATTLITIFEQKVTLVNLSRFARQCANRRADLVLINQMRPIYEVITYRS